MTQQSPMPTSATTAAPNANTPFAVSSENARPTRRGALPDRLLHWALLLCCGLALSKGLADPDFWGHVQFGRDAMLEGLPETADYTYTATAHRWINHENLAELAFALGVDTLGPSALLLLKCLAGMGVLALMLRKAAREGVGQVAAFTGVMLVAGNMMLFWTLRPQLFSFVYFMAMLVLLDRAFRDWSPHAVDWGALARQLAPLPLLMLVWTNTHGGFLAGLCVLFAYLGLRWIEATLVAIVRVRSARAVGELPSEPTSFNEAPAVDARFRPVYIAAATLGGIALACGLVTLINPYGWGLHQWLLMSLREPRPEIIEWRAPEFTLPWIPFWALLLAIVASAAFALRTWRREPAGRGIDWVQFTIIGLTLWQATEHRRHVVFLAMLFGYWMLPAWDKLLKRVGVGVDPATIGESLHGFAKTAFSGGLAATLALLAACLIGQLRQIPVRHDNYPVDAFQFITDHQLSGRLLVQLRWGQYALAAFGDHPTLAQGLFDSDLSGKARSTQGPGNRSLPHLQVAFDGRFRTCYPQAVVDRYFDFAEGVDSKFRNRSPNSPPPDETAILYQDPQPDLVLIDRAMPNSTRVMHHQTDRWVLLYQDPLCRLYGRRDQCDTEGSRNYVPPESRTVRSLPLDEITPWPALPRSSELKKRSQSSQSTRSDQANDIHDGNEVHDEFDEFDEDDEDNAHDGHAVVAGRGRP